MIPFRQFGPVARACGSISVKVRVRFVDLLKKPLPSIRFQSALKHGLHGNMLTVGKLSKEAAARGADAYRGVDCLVHSHVYILCYTQMARKTAAALTERARGEGRHAIIGGIRGPSRSAPPTERGRSAGTLNDAPE